MNAAGPAVCWLGVRIAGKRVVVNDWIGKKYFEVRHSCWAAGVGRGPLHRHYLQIAMAELFRRAANEHWSKALTPSARLHVREGLAGLLVGRVDEQVQEATRLAPRPDADVVVFAIGGAVSGAIGSCIPRPGVPDQLGAQGPQPAPRL